MARNKTTKFEMEIREAISYWITMVLKQKNMSQRELCRRSGIPSGTLAGYIKCISTPNDERIDKIASALQVQPATIDPIRRGKEFKAPVKDDILIDKKLDIAISKLTLKRKKYILQTVEDQLLIQQIEQK